MTHYGSLLNPNMTWLENLLWHQYTECYLYWSCHETETDPRIRKFWAEMYQQEVAHLHIALELLRKYENKDWQQVIKCGEFPEPLVLTSNIEYVRDVLANTVELTSLRENYVCVNELDCGADFFEYQKRVNEPVQHVMSHKVIEEYICKNGCDYRFEVAEHPICELRDRRHDNTAVGRVPEKTMQKA